MSDGANFLCHYDQKQKYPCAKHRLACGPSYRRDAAVTYIQSDAWSLHIVHLRPVSLLRLLALRGKEKQSYLLIGMKDTWLANCFAVVGCAIGVCASAFVGLFGWGQRCAECWDIPGVL